MNLFYSIGILTALFGALAVDAADLSNQIRLVLNQDSFEGHSVLRCNPSEKDALFRFINVVDEYEMDLWSEGFGIDSPIDVHVDPFQKQVLTIDDEFGCDIWIADLDHLIQEEKASSTAAFNSDSGFFSNYHSYDELVSHVKKLSLAYPEISRFVPSIGQTWEGRDIAVIHITSSKADVKKKTVWFDGGIHAREWISSHVVVYLIEQLLVGYGKDETVTKMLDNIEFVISPHINPDGFEYSRTKSRMWRKNRRSNSDGSFGVDLNRNFDIKWGKGGSSRNPSSDTYMGPSAESEPEAKAVAGYIKTLNNTVVGIDFHSYGQLILRPYGYGYEIHPTEPLNKKLGDGIRDAIKKKSGTRYTSERSADLYPVTGGLDDWITSQGPVGYTVELRDQGRYGFVLPKEQILPTGEEIWEGIKFFGQFVIENMPDRE